MGRTESGYGGERSHGVRLRRVDAANPDISNEVIVLDVLITYTVNKIYKTV